MVSKNKFKFNIIFKNEYFESTFYKLEELLNNIV